MKPVAILDHLDVKLEDVASVTTNSDSSPGQKLLLASITHLDSLAAPAKLKREDINQRLLKYLPQRDNIVWGGATTTSIYGKKQVINLQPPIDQLAGELISTMSPQLGSFELTLVNQKLELVNAPMGLIRFRPDIRLLQWTANDFHIPLSVFVDDKLYAKPIVHFKIHSAPTLAFRAESSPIQGQILPMNTSPSPTKEVLVKKDQPIRIMAKTGTIQIESSGIALADGKAGDRLTIHRNGTTDTLIGRVSQNGTVIVGDE